MRVVLDANVLISAIISRHGTPGQILALWKKRTFEVTLSQPILEEISRVIRYPRIQERYNISLEHTEQFLTLLRIETIIVEPTKEIKVIEEDPSDNRYLECAVEGNASFIVTGDKHLLQLKKYKGIVILPPAGFLALLKLEG